MDIDEAVEAIHQLYWGGSVLSQYPTPPELDQALRAIVCEVAFVTHGNN